MEKPMAVAPTDRPIGTPGALGLSGVTVFLLAGAGLYLARDVLVPLALAVLLSFTLAPAVLALRKLQLGRTVAVIVVVGCAFGAIFAIAAMITSQLTSLAQGLPTYQRNIETKIHSLQGIVPGNGLIERASSMMRELNKELTAPRDAPVIEGPPGQKGAEPAPVRVQIWEPDPAPLQVVQSVLKPLLPPLATSGLILLLVVVMLFHREDLRDRLIRLVGAHDLNRTTQAMDDAGSRVSRYLIVQTAINAVFGLAVGVGLALIGVPNPILWGLLALLFRFVPYIGAVLGSIFPISLAIAVDPGWSLLIWTASLYLVLELAVSNVVEPWLYGSSTGLSPIAVIFAAVVWTWLWGPIGLLLSTPLTVCLVVLGRHVPQLAFLDIALGNQPVLTAPERHYQRLVAGDPEEATEQAEDYLSEDDHDLTDFYDTVALPALALAERDRARGTLDDARRELVADSAMTVIDNLAERASPAAAAPADPAASAWGDGTVLCIAARGSLDEAAAGMLAQLLARAGHVTRVMPSGTVKARTVGALDLTGVRAICLSYLETNSLAHARYLTMRLHRRAPSVPILVGFWGAAGTDLADRTDTIRADGVVTSLAAMLAALDTAAAPAPAADVTSLAS